MKTAQALVVPTNIPWDALKGRSLEECVYWLLEAMGAKSLDWRTGGINGGAADGGRDLECVFYVLDPSGEMVVHRWWVEMKGRKGSVSPSDIKESVLTVSGRSNIDIHLIVTNQQLTNPTKDWIAEWQRNHPRPSFRVWERHDLERLVSRHPSVAIRLFPQSVTIQGLAEVLEVRFWDYIIYADQPTLKRIWSNRSIVEWTDKMLLAALISECANGDLSRRPWGRVIPAKRLVQCFLVGMMNSFYFLFRADSAGVRSEPFVKAMSHLLIHLIACHDPKVVSGVAQRFMDFADDNPNLPEEALHLVREPIINQMIHMLGDACAADCTRIISTRNEISSDDAAKYWAQFRFPEGDNGDSEDSKPSLLIESHKAVCNAGLKLSKNTGCPLFRQRPSGTDLTRLFASIRPVIQFRTGLNSLSEHVD